MGADVLTRKVVILGTGSTIGTLTRVAFATELGVRGFVRRLTRKMPKWRSEYCHLAHAIDACGFEDLDQIWTHVDYAGKLHRSLSLERSPYHGDTSGQLHRALLVAYSLTDELEKLDLDSSFTLKTALMQLGDGDVLISFNWDTTAERIADKLGKKLLATGPGLSRHSVNLVKPHGSLSWEDGGKPERTIWRHDDGKPLLDPMDVNCVHPCPGKPMQPLVLGAVPMKERLIQETQKGNPKIYEIFADQWAAVVRAITEARALTVIGYRFPSEDGYGRFLLREAARRRDRPLPEIPYYALEQDKAEIELALREIFGGVQCDFKGPVSPASPKP